jgi:hypothetical protein
MAQPNHKTVLIRAGSMRSTDHMSDDPITYAYPSPDEWRKHLMPDGIQLRIKTSRGDANGAALVIIHAELISEAFGEGDPLKVARENSDSILERAKQAIESSEGTELNIVCLIYDSKKAKPSEKDCIKRD